MLIKLNGDGGEVLCIGTGNLSARYGKTPTAETTDGKHPKLSFVVQTDFHREKADNEKGHIDKIQLTACEMYCNSFNATQYMTLKSLRTWDKVVFFGKERQKTYVVGGELRVESCVLIDAIFFPELDVQKRTGLKGSYKQIRESAKIAPLKPEGEEDDYLF